MATVLEAVFDLRDRITRPMERIRREAEKVERQIEESTRAVRDFERRLDMLNRARSTPTIMLEKRKAEADLKILQAQLRALEARKVTIQVEADTTKARLQLARLAVETKMASSLGGGGMPGRGMLMGAGIVGLIPLLGAALPLVQALGAGATAAAPAMVALGAGMGVVMGVGMPFIKRTQEANEALTKAKEKLADAEVGTEAYADAVKELKAAQEAITPIQERMIESASKIKEVWKDAIKPIEQNIGRGAVALMGAGANIIPQLAPQLQAIGGQAEGAMKGVARFFESPNEVRLLKKMLDPIPETLDRMGEGLGNVFKILQGITIAAQPMAKFLLNAFNAWTKGPAAALQTEAGIKKLQNTIMSFVPILKGMWRVIAEVWNALMRISAAAKPFATDILRSLELVAKALGDVIVALVREVGPQIAPLLKGVAELFTTIGEAAAPVIGKLAAALKILINMLNALPGPVKNLAAQFGIMLLVMKMIPGVGTLVAWGLKGLAGVIGGTLLKSMGAATMGMNAMKFGLTNLTKGGWVGLAIVGVAALSLVISSLMTANRQSAAEKYAETMKEISKAARESAHSLRDMKTATDDLATANISAARANIAYRAAQVAFKRGKADVAAGRITQDEFESIKLDLLEARRTKNQARQTQARGASKAVKVTKAGVADLQTGITESMRGLGVTQERLATVDPTGSIQARIAARPKGAKISPLEAAQTGQVEMLMANAQKGADILANRLAQLTGAQANLPQLVELLAKGGPKAAEMQQKLLQMGEIDPNLSPWATEIITVMNNADLTTKEKSDKIKGALENVGKVKPEKTQIETTVDRIKLGMDKAYESTVKLSDAAAKLVGDNTLLNLLGAAPAGFAGLNPPAGPPAPATDADGALATPPTASGIIAFSRQVRTIGEEGPEAVIPLLGKRRLQRQALMRAASRRVGGGGTRGQSPLVQIGSVTINSREEGQAFEDRLVSAIQRAKANVPQGDPSGMYA